MFLTKKLNYSQFIRNILSTKNIKPSNKFYPRKSLNLSKTKNKMIHICSVVILKKNQKLNDQRTQNVCVFLREHLEIRSASSSSIYPPSKQTQHANSFEVK